MPAYGIARAGLEGGGGGGGAASTDFAGFGDAFAIFRIGFGSSTGFCTVFGSSTSASLGAILGESATASGSADMVTGTGASVSVGLATNAATTSTADASAIAATISGMRLFTGATLIDRADGIDTTRVGRSSGAGAPGIVITDGSCSSGASARCRRRTVIVGSCAGASSIFFGAG